MRSLKKIGLLFLPLILLVVYVSCKETNEKPIETITFNELDYVLDDAYSVGDVRRYGLTLKNANQIHPQSEKRMLETVLDIAEHGNIEMHFQKGYYGTNLILNERKDINLKFDRSEFSMIHIVRPNDTLPSPENITLKGTLICYATIGITNAINIAIDSVILKSDPSKNFWGLRNSGCHIYVGSKDIKINYLEVQDLGSGDNNYKNAHAALAIDGANNNPQNVQIKKVHIKSTDRHGIYMTGQDHLIGTVIIDKFGLGSSEGMSGMQDAAPGEEKEFKALWINKCYDSFIENIIINEKDSKGTYTAHFDSGDMRRPVIIGNFKVLNDQTDMTILEDDNHGVIIEIKE